MSNGTTDTTPDLPINGTPRQRVGRGPRDVWQVALKRDGRTWLKGATLDFDDVGPYLRQLVYDHPGAYCVGQLARVWGRYGEQKPVRPPRPPAPRPVLLVVDETTIPAHLVQQMGFGVPEPVLGKECEICLGELDPQNHAVLDGSMFCLTCFLTEEAPPDSPLGRLEALRLPAPESRPRPHARIRVQPRGDVDCQIATVIDGVQIEAPTYLQSEARAVLRAKEQSLLADGCTVEFFGKHTPRFLGDG